METIKQRIGPFNPYKFFSSSFKKSRHTFGFGSFDSGLRLVPNLVQCDVNVRNICTYVKVVLYIMENCLLESNPIKTIVFCQVGGEGIISSSRFSYRMHSFRSCCVLHLFMNGHLDLNL